MILIFAYFLVLCIMFRVAHENYFRDWNDVDSLTLCGIVVCCSGSIASRLFFQDSGLWIFEVLCGVLTFVHFATQEWGERHRTGTLVAACLAGLMIAHGITNMHIG